MTEQPVLPAIDEAPESLVSAPKSKRRDLVPWLYGLGFLVLAVAIFYLWQYPSSPSETATDASAIQAVGQRLAEIDARLTRLEQRPPPDLGKLTARIDALDSRVGDQTQLPSRLDAVSGRIDALAARDQTSLDATKQQIDTLARRIAATESSSGNVDAVNKRLTRINRLQEISTALASGRPIGDLPNAPEALSRYAHAAPPTEAQLRLRFPRDEQAALATDQPNESDTPFIDRVWDRAQGLITVRRGDTVVVGNPAATILSHAQIALDAGDMVGAVNAVKSLKGPPAQAMAAWLGDAKALLEARSALADMTDQI